MPQQSTPEPLVSDEPRPSYVLVSPVGPIGQIVESAEDKRDDAESEAFASEAQR